LVYLNRRQLLAVKQLITKVEFEDMILVDTPGSSVVGLTMTDLNGNELSLVLDKEGRGQITQEVVNENR
jgi:hypothetical protein